MTQKVDPGNRHKDKLLNIILSFIRNIHNRAVCKLTGYLDAVSSFIEALKTLKRGLTVLIYGDSAVFVLHSGLVSQMRHT